MSLFFKIGYTLFIIISLLFLSIISYAQITILYPKERPIKDYHRYWLKRLQSDNIDIQYHYSRDKISYLLLKATAKTKQSIHIKHFINTLRYKNNYLKAINSKIVVLFHGKNGRKEDLLPLCERYIAMGFTCIVPDLPAHGDSKMAKFVLPKNYLDNILDDASKYIDLKDKKISIWGFSLGAAVAIKSVVDSKYKFNSMVLVSTFDNLENVVIDKTSTFFGTFIAKEFGLVLCKSLKNISNFDIDSLDSKKYAKKLNIPVLIIHGKKDSIVDYKRAKELYKTFASTKKEFILKPSSNHYTILKDVLKNYSKSGEFLIDELDSI